MKHVLIINRYDDEFSNYAKYIDHNKFKVSYVSLKDKDHHICSNSSQHVRIVDELTPDTYESPQNTFVVQ